MSKIPVAILGATGTVGQKFISLLENHPQFSVVELVASTKSSGKLYKDAVHWKQAANIPQSIANIEIQSIDSTLNSPILFSGLDSSVAGSAEEKYAEAGHMVISNSKNHRMDPLVPLVIPEVNADHFELLRLQPYKGGIVTNSNCSTMFLAMLLAAIQSQASVDSVFVSTMQAVSGAGFPGIPSMDILGNTTPYIPGEEEKLETEPQKILGTFTNNSIQHADFTISAQCNRVPVYDGHSENISIKCKEAITVEDAKRAIAKFNAEKSLDLYSAPDEPVVVLSEEDRPQAALDLWRNNGMSTVVGRIRPCSLFDIKMTILGHNTVRGAAGAAILNAEALLKLGYIQL